MKTVSLCIRGSWPSDKLGTIQRRSCEPKLAVFRPLRRFQVMSAQSTDQPATLDGKVSGPDYARPQGRPQGGLGLLSGTSSERVQQSGNGSVPVSGTAATGLGATYGSLGVLDRSVASIRNVGGVTGATQPLEGAQAPQQPATTQAPQQPAPAQASQEPASAQGPQQPPDTQAVPQPEATKAPQQPATTQAPHSAAYYNRRQGDSERVVDDVWTHGAATTRPRSSLSSSTSIYS